ncbi:hypothetical protein BH10PSE12_BH10PSE12_01640 [soil metagenome]
MLDPFTFYSRMVSAVLGMAGTAQRAAETMNASQEVIAKRTSMMGTAAQSPLDGNYAELGRMIPEKVDAFAKAGAAIASDWWAMQSAFMTEAQHLGSMALKGRAPTLTEFSALSARNAAFMLTAFERGSAIGAKGLDPIHASATANARRLRRTPA